MHPHDAQGRHGAPAKGLYTPSLEKDACGTGLIAQLDGQASHQLVEDALLMLRNMEHRGACGCEPDTGDGAGILVQTPHAFFAKKCRELGFDLPDFGAYGVGVVFFPADRHLRRQCRVLFDDYIDELGFHLLGYRKVPTDHEDLGESAIASEPRIEQVFVRPKQPLPPDALERKLYVLRKYATHNIQRTFPQAHDAFYLPSFSYKTVIYKGQLTTHQLRPYFPDLHDALFASAIALVHSRFSTNTTPKWKLAQPFRYIAHNGEINTIAGNINWWLTKERLLESTHFSPEEIQKLRPVCGESLSDSGNLDNVLEFLTLGGYALPHALMMMIPEAWQHDAAMPDAKRAFYDLHRAVMEPWDGPASLCFTDGQVVGATLDRNGLRPARYCLTEDNVLVLASEAGALPIDPARVRLKGRLQPGRMLVADLAQRRIIGDEELKAAICGALPYRAWLDAHKLSLDELPPAPAQAEDWPEDQLLCRQRLHGFTREDLRLLLGPMAKDGYEPIGSMGADTPLAALSQRPQHLSHYFKQLFAQVTNPPIDPIRERAVMSLFTAIGGGGNILRPSAAWARFLHLDSPVLGHADLARFRHWQHPHFKVGSIDILMRADGQAGRLHAAIDHVCALAEDFARSGTIVLILSDKNADAQQAPLPSLLAVGAIHHHLIRKGLRSQISILVEAGDLREVHHVATLIGYGATAVSPYLAYASIAHLWQAGALDAGQPLALYFQNYKASLEKGLLKVLSKIGISTLQSYRGAQTFEALGLAAEVVDKCFRGTVSRLGGLGFDELANELLAWHRAAFPGQPLRARQLEAGGLYQWKRDGEAHLFNPQSIHHLQVAARTGDAAAYRRYADCIDVQNQQAMTLRGLLAFRKGSPIGLEEVEPAEAIMRRFATGAMSFGSISHEAHSTLAIAMNRIGGKSNSGEGGEDEARYERLPNGDSMRSAIKQVASGRFGVTSHYLAQAEELQIKMAQGAKPGEGGQLPGHKVDAWIGRVRHATPGVGLISPPPHHDIYSIEDLAQLIFDLKNANRHARIGVKLVSRAGVGIIASGVAKAKAEAILIAGHDGGTGASPLSSIRHAGLPWELGLAEAQQTLVRNGLRERVVLQVDGQIRTGRDLAIATLLGAEEWGVATAALVVTGCVMMRKCHANTCPVGIATQDPELRRRFTGQAEHVVQFFRFLAEDLRRIMADLGFRTVDEMVGRVEMLKLRQDPGHWKCRQLDLRPLLYKEASDDSIGQRQRVAQDHGLSLVLDRQLIRLAQQTLATGHPLQADLPIRNTDRAVGTMLSHEVSLRYGAKGLPEGSLHFRFRGSAGQSFGAFAAPGLRLHVEGEANDYFGKGLSGATLSVAPDREARFEAAGHIIIGNVALYGATSGQAFVAGQAGERFAVRNSGALAVVEGLGDHGCEYMTGGCVLVLGRVGRNFGAGMSGGLAYLLGTAEQIGPKLNPDGLLCLPPDAEDLARIRALLAAHHAHTGSAQAEALLADWPRQAGGFAKVLAAEYHALLQQHPAAAPAHQPNPIAL